MGQLQISRIEEGLGRRLRPWWGQAPGRLAIQGAFGTVICGAIVYLALMVRAGKIGPADFDLDEQQSAAFESSLHTAALVAAGIAALFVVYNLVKLVVGAIDVAGNEVFEGTVVSARERRLGDVLPWYLQWLLFRRRNNETGYTNEMRKTRYELVVQSGTESRSWNTRPGFVSTSLEGTQVRVKASRLLGYVRRVDQISGPSRAERFG